METEELTPPPAQPNRTRWQRLRKRLGRAVLLYAAVPYIAVIIIFALFQRQLMYRPTAAKDLSTVAIGKNADFGEDVELATADGHTIRGWLVKASASSQPAIDKHPLLIYFPGNSLNRHERISDLQEVASRGFDVLIFDYRGFGDSTGSPGESALSADALLVWQFACETLGYNQNQITVFGESIGGAVALSMWSKTNPNPPQPAALILSSTFASMSQTVRDHYPMFPFHFLLLDRWPSVERIGEVESRIIIFHGTDDQMVPVAQSHALVNAARNATLIEIPGGTHNDIPTAQLRKELNALKQGFASESN